MLYFMRIGFIAIALLFVTSCDKDNNDDLSGAAEGTALDFRMELVNGGVFNAAHCLGSVVVVNFWDTWCIYCRMEQENLNQLYTNYRDEGLELIGVSLGEEGLAEVNAYLAEFNVEYTSGLTGYSVEAVLGRPSGIPTTYVINREGEIVVAGWFEYDELVYIITPLLEN